jgi:hypothetical protein
MCSQQLYTFLKPITGMNGLGVFHMVRSFHCFSMRARSFSAYRTSSSARSLYSLVSLYAKESNG